MADIAPDTTVEELVERYKNSWQNEPESYWFYRLSQELGELGSSLAGDHEHPPIHELKQIASIATNWIRKIEASQTLSNRNSRMAEIVAHAQGHPLTQDQVDLIVNGVSTDSSGYKAVRDAADGLEKMGALIFRNGAVFNLTELGLRMRVELSNSH